MIERKDLNFLHGIRFQNPVAGTSRTEFETQELGQLHMQKLELDELNRLIDRKELHTLVSYSDSQISRFEK